MRHFFEAFFLLIDNKILHKLFNLKKWVNHVIQSCDMRHVTHDVIMMSWLHSYETIFHFILLFFYSFVLLIWL